MSFDLDDWKRRFEANSDRAERNAMMDSGWSKTTADACERTALGLWNELGVAIAATKTIPADFFDRPDLVAVQEAARYATNAALDGSSESQQEAERVHWASVDEKFRKQ